jgi:galactitol-specific phosphotransferase system IIB component
MEKSASAPHVLHDSDYHLQKWGIDERTNILGVCGKDPGTNSTLMNMTIKNAKKVPGPDTYLAHKNWDHTTAGVNQGNIFVKTSKFTTTLNAVPAPSTYERKDVNTLASNKGKDNLSKIRRTQFGPMSKGARRSFIDREIKFSLSLPGPGTFTPQPKSCNKLDAKNDKGLVSWSRQMVVTKSPNSATKADLMAKVGPATYQVDRSYTENREPIFSVPKDPCANFLDKAVKERMVDHRAKKEYPGPPQYGKDGWNFHRTSHGPIQKSSLARASVSTYF